MSACPREKASKTPRVPFQPTTAMKRKNRTPRKAPPAEAKVKHLEAAVTAALAGKKIDATETSAAAGCSWMSTIYTRNVLGRYRSQNSRRSLIARAESADAPLTKSVSSYVAWPPSRSRWRSSPS